MTPLFSLNSNWSYVLGFPRWLSDKGICLPMQETQEKWVQSLGWEGFLEEEMATQSSILAWVIPWTQEPDGLQSTGSERVRHNWVTEWVRVYLKAPAGVTSQKKDTWLLRPEGISLIHPCALKDHWILRFSFISYCLTASGCFSSVQFSHTVLSDSLRPHGLQHARLPCPLPTPGVYSNLCPLSQWCHPTISSSVVPFSCL